MEFKLFGKTLFEFKKEEHYPKMAINQIQKSEFLPDFQKRSFGGEMITLEDAVLVSNSTTQTWNGGMSGSGEVVQNLKAGSAKAAEKPKIEEKDKLTPKGVYQARMLHNLAYKLNTKPEYVDKQIEMFKDKLSMISAEEYDMRNGLEEIGSILIRLENRKKYPEHKEFFDEFPYTTRDNVSKLLKDHDYLQLGQVAQFLADMPKEASDVMKRYTKETVDICKLKPVFYIIADKKDFKKTEKRRDPILLAQSPFAIAWQILGAWDKEMLLVDEL